MADFFIKSTSIDRRASVTVCANERTYKDLPQRVMVAHNVGLNSIHAHLSMQQVEELADALFDALDWVRGIPIREAAAAEQARRETAEAMAEAHGERPSITNPGEYDVPGFIKSASI